MDSNSGILSENTKANYTERYDLLLKMKNHVTTYYGYYFLFKIAWPFRVVVGLKAHKIILSNFYSVKM